MRHLARHHHRRDFVVAPFRAALAAVVVRGAPVDLADLAAPRPR